MHKEKQEITEQIREIIKTEGLGKAIKSIKTMIKDATGPLRTWLKEVLRYLELIARRIEEERERNDLLLEEDLKSIEEELEREAEISKLWMQLSLGAWSAVDVAWQGVIANVFETVLSDMSFSPR